MNSTFKPWRPRLGQSVVRANMAGAGAALTIAGVLLIAFQFVALHAALVRDVHVQARIIGANSGAALLFNDRKAAEDTLDALHAVVPDGRYRVVPLLRSLAERDGSFFEPGE